MLALLALPVVVATAFAYRYIQVYAPSNLLIRSVQASTPRWHAAGLLVALSAVVLVLMHAVARAVVDGGPGWLHVVVLVLAWDCLKYWFAACSVAARCVRRVCGHSHIALDDIMRDTHKSCRAN